MTRTLLRSALVPLYLAGISCSGGTPSESSPDATSGTTPPADSGPGPSVPVSDASVTPGDPGVDPGTEGQFSSYTKSASIEVGSNDVALTTYIPDTAGPLPVVVLMHGFQLPASQYTSYGEHLASWGYIVVTPEFPGGLFGGPNHRQLKEMYIGVLDWIEAQATVTDGPLDGKANASAIALAGHSLGGKISLLVASEDDRPKAVFGVDPVDAAGGPFSSDGVDFPSVTPELMPQLSVPLVLLGETLNATGGLGGACAPADNNFQQYYEHAVSKSLEIELVGANHMSFLDNPNCGFACSSCPEGTDDKATTRLLTRRYMTAFFNAFIKSESNYRDFLVGDAMNEDIAAGLTTTRSKNGF